MSVTASDDVKADSPYRGGFSSWKDVSDNFSGWGNDNEIAEPEEVLFAGYDNEDYSGSATVLYRQGDKFFTVDGNHCSCMGLEGQWEPEEYASKELLIAALLRNGSYDWRSYGADLMKALGIEPEAKEAA